jgi:hypothetical protein
VALLSLHHTPLPTIVLDCPALGTLASIQSFSDFRW